MKLRKKQFYKCYLTLMSYMWIIVIYRVYVGIWTKSSNVYWEVNIESTKSMYVQKFGRGSTARCGGATVRRRVCVCVCVRRCVCGRGPRLRLAVLFVDTLCIFEWIKLYENMNFISGLLFVLILIWNINPCWAPRLRSREN